MAHAIRPTSTGWLVFSYLGAYVLDASLFDDYGEALDAYTQLLHGSM